MFTGIVEELGKVKGISNNNIQIEATKVLEDTKIGDSICVNGVCLTVTSISENAFTADVMPETFSRSNLGSLEIGDFLDLERSLASDGRFGGHIVSGHIDGTGVIKEKHEEGNAVVVTISTSKEILDLIVEKGSIAIDGISLTVTDVNNSDFSVSVIPHTGSETVLLKKEIGSLVNLENDIVGKYIKKFMINENQNSDESLITEAFLLKNGF